MVDTSDLKSDAERRAGSNPASCTISYKGGENGYLINDRFSGDFCGRITHGNYRCANRGRGDPACRCSGVVFYRDHGNQGMVMV